MRYYHYLSKIKFLQKYSYKFLFVSFLGIHVPLIGIILFLVLGPANYLKPSTIILLTLFLTLGATGITLYLLHQLIEPIRLVQSALHNYLTKHELPALPIQYKDEAGILLHDVQHTINEVNLLLEEKRDLLTILSHDLQSPVLNIQQAVFLAREEKDPATQEEYFAAIDKSATEQIDLITMVNSLWQHESTNVKLYELYPVKIFDLVEQTLHQQAVKLKQKEIYVNNEVRPEHYACAALKMLQEVFTNLIFNAIKYSRPQDTIRIKSEVDGEKIKIYFTDQGIGFNPDHAEKLFDRFTKYRKKGTTGEGTNGLGLYLCRKILQKQDGTISAFSPGEEKGAVFIVELKTAPVQK